MKIELTQNKFAEIDETDHKLISQFKWCLSAKRYALTYNSKTKKLLLMHRLIMQTPKGLETDHINGNKLDNRRNNLRIVTRSQNALNVPNKKVKGRTSKYKNVSWTKRDKKWLVHVQAKQYKAIFIGYFEKERHAALAADLWNKDIHGDFAKLNFNSI